MCVRESFLGVTRSVCSSVCIHGNGSGNVRGAVFRAWVQGPGTVFPALPAAQQRQQRSLTKFRVRRLGKLHIYFAPQTESYAIERGKRATTKATAKSVRKWWMESLGHFALKAHYRGRGNDML